MLEQLMRLDLTVVKDPAHMVLVFFAYSHIGYLMECMVLSAEHRRLVVNRGFVRHLPFCIIYGFGAMIGVPILQLFEYNLLLLFIASAVGASMLELMTARIQQYLFGDFWWDYTKKPFNYQGVLCLESTLGWGVAGIIIVKFLHKGLVTTLNLVPVRLAVPLAALLLIVYATDFFVSARASRREKQIMEEEAYAKVEYTERRS